MADEIELSLEQIKNMNGKTILIKESFDCNGIFDDGKYVTIDTTKYEDGAWNEQNNFLYWYDLYSKFWIAYQ